MTERMYKDGKFKPERCSFYIYCTVCNFLIFICENIEEYANDHLKSCIVKTAERYSAYFKSYFINVQSM